MFSAKTGKQIKIDYEKMFATVPNIKPEKLVLDADQMLMIMIYVLLQSKISLVKLYSHIRLVYEFQTESQKNSQKGYCVSSMEICLESIFEEEPQHSEDNHKTAADTVNSNDQRGASLDVTKDQDTGDRILSFHDNMDQQLDDL